MGIVRVAFCGAGGIVRGCHLPALETRADRFRVVGFYDVVAENAARLAGDKYRVWPSYEALLADGEVDLVVVATKPLTTHFPCARAALAAGKHVVLEKPMAATAQECDELIALARSRALTLTVHHNRRLNIDFLAVQDILRTGKVGEPCLIENRKPSSGYEGGDFVDWGVHLVDQCLLLNPGPLTEVSALFRIAHGGAGNAGFVEATLRFAEPPVVRVAMMPRPQEYLTNGTPAADRFYVAGTTGAFIQRTVEDIRDLLNATQNFDKGRPDFAVPPYLTVTQKLYYDYLHESLSGGAPLLVRPEEARNAIRAIELIEESARTGRSVPATGMLTIDAL